MEDDAGLQDTAGKGDLESVQGVQAVRCVLGLLLTLQQHIKS